MIGNYLTFLLLSWLISQSLKFFFKKNIKKSSLKDFKNTFLFYSGPPSTHAAVLTMTFFYLKEKIRAESSILIIFIVFSILWFYEIYMQRRRFNSIVEMMGGHKGREKEIFLHKEFHGHESTDMLIGIIVGTLSFFMLNFLFS